MAKKDGKKTKSVEIEGHKIAVSNLDKVLYRATRFTKGQVIDYYVRMSKYLLPHLKDRPVTLKRFPDGVRGEFFYEKNAPSYTPEWIKRFGVPSKTRGSDIHYILIDNLATLVWLANIANLEIHPFLHRVPRLERPTSVVFDLDPGEGSDVLTCARAALSVRDILDGVGLKSFAKVSGSKGIQMYIPLNTQISYDVTTPFAKAVAELMEQRYPDLIVSRMAKNLRAAKVFIDWSQNSEHKTTVSVYSLRAKSDRPFVSLPVIWDELGNALKGGDPAKLYWEPEAALERVQQKGDLFEPVLRLKQHLPAGIMDAIRPKGGPTHRVRAKKAEAEPAGSTAAYRQKRDFTKTPEPSPSGHDAKIPERSRQGSRRRFVVQKHAASHLHYDFRLEMQGVLKSWAVPKGPPFSVGEKRLAMATEDHPIDYLSFEGIIPKGQYGGGTVMVWDIGNYELIEGNYFKGFLRFYLQGKKLKGQWTLNRSHEEPGNKWYFVKTGSAMPALADREANVSALSGRSMENIALHPAAEWQSNRAAGGNAKLTERSVQRPAALPEGPDLNSLPEAKMHFVEPMMAKPIQRLPEAPGWIFEIKLDGYRALVVKTGSRVQLFSRRGNNLHSKFPTIASAFDALPSGTILDGEVVALDSKGRPSFNALQNWHSTEKPIYFYAFDLLAYEGKDVSGLPLSERRRLLEQFALRGLSDPVRLSPRFEISGQELVRAVKQQGLEGVVAKRADSIYRAGERSDAWAKYKTANGQELVIGGYMPGKYGFDSLLVGYYDRGKLQFVGKVRNGFIPVQRQEVANKFKGLETDKCPFANLPEPKTARRGEALTAEAMKKCRWLKPRLVAQIEFADWTAANHLRHSRFVGLRGDKDPREVTREVAQHAEMLPVLLQ